MVQQNTSERRDYVRAKRVLSIQYRLKKSKGKKVESEWDLSTTHDMSVGGLSFITKDQFHVGDVLELKVVMSGVLDIFNGEGKVIRVEQKSTGAYFLTAIKYVNLKHKLRRAKAYVEPKTSIKRSVKRI